MAFGKLLSGIISKSYPREHHLRKEHMLSFLAGQLGIVRPAAPSTPSPVWLSRAAECSLGWCLISLSLPSQGCLISQSVLPGGVVSLARHVTMAAQLVTEDSGPRHLLLLQCRIPRQPLLGSTLCLGHMGVESWRGPTQSHSHIFPSEFVFCLPTSFPAG